MADVIAKWKMVTPLCESIMCGRCYCQVEIETHQGGGWQMLQPSGRWNGHCIILILVLGCQTEPHPIYVADGICPHFC